MGGLEQTLAVLCRIRAAFGNFVVAFLRCVVQASLRTVCMPMCLTVRMTPARCARLVAAARSIRARARAPRPLVCAGSAARVLAIRGARLSGLGGTGGAGVLGQRPRWALWARVEVVSTQSSAAFAQGARPALG